MKLSIQMQRNSLSHGELTVMQSKKLSNEECGLTTDEWNKKIDHLRKYNLYPIMIEEVEEKII